MKEWICEEIPALTLDGKVISTMLHQEQELIRCKDCKYRSKELYDYYGNPNNKVYVCQIRDLAKNQIGSVLTGNYDALHLRMTFMSLARKVGEVNETPGV